MVSVTTTTGIFECRMVVGKIPKRQRVNARRLRWAREKHPMGTFVAARSGVLCVSGPSSCFLTTTLHDGDFLEIPDTSTHDVENHASVVRTYDGPHTGTDAATAYAETEDDPFSPRRHHAHHHQLHRSEGHIICATGMSHAHTCCLQVSSRVANCGQRGH